MNVQVYPQTVHLNQPGDRGTEFANLTPLLNWQLRRHAHTVSVNFLWLL